MSFVTARRVRKQRGHRLGGLGFALIDRTISVADVSSSGVPAPAPEPYQQVTGVATSFSPMAPTPSFRPVVGASTSFAPMAPEQPMVFFLPGVEGPPPAVIDTDGEVISETSVPMPTDQGFDAAAAGVVTDLSPTLVPTRPAWKTWLPIGIAVLGIAGAVLILRKK